MEKHSVSRLSYLFAHLHLLSSYSFSSTLLSSNLSLLSAASLLCFSSVHIVGSLTSKLPSMIIHEHGRKQGHAAVSGAGRFGSWLAAISVSVKQSWHGCPHISFTVAAPHPAVNPIPQRRIHLFAGCILCCDLGWNILF